MELFQHTLFINLDYRTDRLAHVKGELDKLGIQGERLNAVKMKAGNVGCTLSHIKCLDLAIERGWDQVFICEDDITFTNPAVLLESARKFVESGISWDVLVIGGNNCPPYEEIGDFCARVHNIQTTTGYIVKKEYYQVLLTNFKEGLAKLMREPDKKKQYSIDIYWKNLQHTDRWFILKPLTVIQYYDFSDIEEKVVDYAPMMLDFEKKALIEKLIREKQEEERKKISPFVMNFGV
jgi:GR25 family glycosyltransferase involved in LPS biosynthesis